jgi:phosphatidylserine decarboxylase
MKKKTTYIIFGLLGVGLLGNIYFNRNPKRKISIDGNLLAPSDGIIKSITDNKIEIFIRLTDVHIQRVPCDCEIISIENDNNYYDKYLLQTEFGEIILERKGGILARSIRSFYKEGDLLNRGDEYGRILLGSHCWITVPQELNILVNVGDILKAGETIIA